MGISQESTGALIQMLSGRIADVLAERLGEASRDQFTSREEAEALQDFMLGMADPDVTQGEVIERLRILAGKFEGRELSILHGVEREPTTH